MASDQSGPDGVEQHKTTDALYPVISTIPSGRSIGFAAAASGVRGGSFSHPTPKRMWMTKDRVSSSRPVASHFKMSCANHSGPVYSRRTEASSRFRMWSSLECGNPRKTWKAFQVELFGNISTTLSRKSRPPNIDVVTPISVKLPLGVIDAIPG